MTVLLPSRRAAGTSDGAEAGGLAPAVVLPPAAGTFLLRLARAAIQAVTGRASMPDPYGDDGLPPALVPLLTAPAGTFVTLHEAGELRGCVGTLEADRPLWQSVVFAAVAAAVDDPRFRPVTTDEVEGLTIDVSVLGPAVPLRDPAGFRPGLDGLIVVRDGRRGVLLPEVATDQGWGVDEMLAMTCRKAGLPTDAWREAGTEVLAFRTARVSDAGRGWDSPGASGQPG